MGHTIRASAETEEEAQDTSRAQNNAARGKIKCAHWSDPATIDFKEFMFRRLVVFTFEHKPCVTACICNFVTQEGEKNVF